MVLRLRSKRQLDMSQAAKLTEAVAEVTDKECTLNKAAKEAGIDRRHSLVDSMLITFH